MSAEPVPVTVPPFGARPAGLRARLEPLSRPWPTAVLLGALTVLGAVVRYRAMASSLWLDEAQAVAIAHRSLGAIPHALRLDGSPPLYYLLLHAWMRVVGSSDVQVHLLSVACAALCVPAAWLAGRLAAGPRAAWMAAALMTTNSFLSAYADQARMYTLLALLALLAVAAFLAVFVHRRRRLAPAFSLALALVLYTHNWGFFLAAGCAAAVAVLWWTGGRDRRLLVDAGLGFGLAALLYVPWVPILVDQIRHTGAPWSVHPGWTAIQQAVAGSVGGEAAGVLLLVVGGAGVVRLLRSREPARPAALTLVVLCVATLVLALAYCELSLAWSPRYLAVLAGPLTVLAAVGLSRVSGGMAVATVVLALALTIAQPPYDILHNKSNVARMAYLEGAHLRRGDLVVSTQPEQVPALAHYLPAGLRYATPYGPVSDPAIMDWRDVLPKLRAARVRRDLEPLVARLRPGQHVLLVDPITDPTQSNSQSTWVRLVRRRKMAWLDALEADPRLRRIGGYLNHTHASFSAVSALLFVRR